MTPRLTRVGGGTHTAASDHSGWNIALAEIPLSLDFDRRLLHLRHRAGLRLRDGGLDGAGIPWPSGGEDGALVRPDQPATYGVPYTGQGPLLSTVAAVALHVAIVMGAYKPF